MNIAIITLFYISLGQSWNILGGLTGIFSIAHSVFFGIGVYSTIISVDRFGLPFFTGVIIGICFNIITAFVFGLIGSKLSGLYFAMGLIGLQMIFYSVAQQWNAFTGGTQGIALPREFLLSKSELFFIALLAAVFSLLLFYFLRKSRIGTYFVAIRENPNLSLALGVNIVKWRVVSTIISACLASLIGNLYSLYMMSTNPEIFSLGISLKIIIIVLVGGIGSLWGPVLGASLIILDELIRGAMPSKFAALSVVIYASILIVVVMLKPEGLIGIRFNRKKISNQES